MYLPKSNGSAYQNVDVKLEIKLGRTESELRCGSEGKMGFGEGLVNGTMALTYDR